VRTASVSELKSRLSSYLAYVQQGEEIIVRDRNRPIGGIVPLTAEGGDEIEETALVPLCCAQAGPTNRSRALPRQFPKPVVWWGTEVEVHSALAQLAAALVWCQERPRRRSFVCFDDRLSLAAEKVGFAVYPQ